MTAPAVALNTMPLEVEPEVKANDDLKEALRIVRGFTFAPVTDKHLFAVNASRKELLRTLQQSSSLLDALVNEIEKSFGVMPTTRTLVATLKHVADVEEAL
ncbi:MAG TPA: hypothetical protein VGK24_05205 [Candidatus Angelobacter sp.]|jgi:hypothetical protein